MYRVQSLWLVGVLTLSVLGCGKLKDDPNPSADQVTPEAVADVVKGNNEFACTLYNQLAKEARPTDNILFSPYSISAALAMTYAGARGKTAEEMANVLRFDRNQERFHPAFAELTRRLLRPADGAKNELTVANAIWPDERLALLPSFERVMTSHYGTGMRRLNYYEPEGARHTINDWVAERTERRIKELLPEGALDIDTKMVLTNAITFQGAWEQEFDKSKTSLQPFYNTPTDSVMTPMMHAEMKVSVAAGSGIQVASLPYARGRYAMIVLVPDSHQDFAEAEKQLPRLLEWLPQLKTRQMPVTLPKFKFSQAVQLKEPLKKNGMVVPFDQWKAEFSGMSTRHLHIKQIFHEATVDLNEAGTSSAAATGVVLREVVRRGGLFLNRPFMFVILDTQTSLSLFIGRVVSPSQR